MVTCNMDAQALPAGLVPRNTYRTQAQDLKAFDAGEVGVVSRKVRTLRYYHPSTHAPRRRTHTYTRPTPLPARSRHASSVRPPGRTTCTRAYWHTSTHLLMLQPCPPLELYGRLVLPATACFACPPCACSTTAWRATWPATAGPAGALCGSSTTATLATPMTRWCPRRSSAASGRRGWAAAAWRSCCAARTLAARRPSCGR